MDIEISKNNMIHEYFEIKMLIEMARWKEQGEIGINPDSVLARVFSIEDLELEKMMAFLGIRTMISDMESLVIDQITDNIPIGSSALSRVDFIGCGIEDRYLAVDSGDSVPVFHGKSVLTPSGRLLLSS